MNRTYDLTQGNIRRSLILFSLPLIAGNLLQQMYNVADTMIVGQFLGSVPLAAVGTATARLCVAAGAVTGADWVAGAATGAGAGVGSLPSSTPEAKVVGAPRKPLLFTGAPVESSLCSVSLLIGRISPPG